MKSFENILGLNKRNVSYIYEHNERQYYQLADDKLLSKNLLEKHGFPTPKLLFEFEHFFELPYITKALKDKSDFVIKPTHGRGGGGILVFDKYLDNSWLTISGEELSAEDVYQHCAMILSGVYSLDGSQDVVMVEERIVVDELFSKISYKGIPDIRVIVFKKEPVMAMLRIPTKKSKGKANLHMGGIAAGIGLKDGITFVADSYHKGVKENPDNGEKIVGLKIPYWDVIMELSAKIQDIVPLGYMGIDWVIDKRYGPQILELNVRPGLEIQNVNGIGLNSKLRDVEDIHG